jgi:hypothetical protein
MPRPPRIGRPRAYRRKAKVSVVLETAELLAIERAARRAGMTTSAWLRAAAVAALNLSDERKR